MRPGSLLRKIALQPLLSRLSVKESIVLDLGGFDGLISKLLIQRNPRQAIVVDLDMSGLRDARACGLRPFQASALHLPFKDASVDQVLCLDLIEHVQQDQAVLEEIGRVLRPGGKVLLTTPCAEFHLPFTSRERVNKAWGHVRNGYSDRELETLFERAGIQLVERGYYFNAPSRLFYSLFFFLNIPPQGTRLKLKLFQGIAALERWFHLGAQEHCVIGEKQALDSFNAEEYWDRRLRNNSGLGGVGLIGYSERYNEWLYLAKERCLLKSLQKANISSKGQRVLDVGSGTGYWLEWYSRRGAEQIVGIDISRIAVHNLRKNFPNLQIKQADITKEIPLEGSFGIVNALDVFFHIVEIPRFYKGLENIVQLTEPGGWIIISDRLGKSEAHPASHVFFHSLHSYANHLTDLGCEIVTVEPLYFFLNGELFDKMAIIGRTRPLLRMAEESLAPLLYWLDGIFLPSRFANLKILIARREK